MQTVDDFIKETRVRVSKAEQQQRLSARQQRQAELKKAQRRYYIIGEIFCKYFSEVMSLEPGTKDENIVIFKPVEDFLRALSLNEQVVKYLACKANCKRFWVHK